VEPEGEASQAQQQLIVVEVEVRPVAEHRQTRNAAQTIETGRHLLELERLQVARGESRRHRLRRERLQELRLVIDPPFEGLPVRELRRKRLARPSQLRLYVLAHGLDVVNADMQSFAQLEENVIAATTSQKHFA
jgi:hypothetical protein